MTLEAIFSIVVMDTLENLEMIDFVCFQTSLSRTESKNSCPSQDIDEILTENTGLFAPAVTLAFRYPASVSFNRV